ncbi:hypothetical protein CBR_g52163 [Chara braunii]|uniref:Reverse transcriptase domain-containing protein n=1 Tax=Chara braunii TaxID=69332 RepID=A0A388M9M7_CHABU|nr:hypothetical protein CBR_g52163 [Chara braunii]|eukprot:GBG91278.1 hypothetical protein CBR_g52163 [Chara braunii]
MAAFKWEIRGLKDNHESIGRSNLNKQIDELRAEMDLLRKQNEKTEEVAQLWRSEALRPGNKRGSINISTPASEGRTATRSRLGGGTTGTDDEARRLRAEVQELQERRRCDQTDVDMLKERCAKAEAQRMEAEAELSRLREQLESLSTEGAGAGTPQVKGTNLKERMDDAAKTGFRTGRRGRVKMTPGRLPREGSARKVNDRFAFVQDERKRDSEHSRREAWNRYAKKRGLSIRRWILRLMSWLNSTRRRDLEGVAALRRGRILNRIMSMDSLFLSNPGFVLCQDESAAMESCAARFREEGFERLGKWNPAGDLGQSYSIPKHKDITKWRPICPTHSECGVRASKRAAQSINELLWDLPSATNFNLKSMADLAATVGKVNKELRKGECFLSAAFDIKEMFCNLPHDAIMKAVRWVVDFWMIQGCKGVLVNQRGKGAKLRFGGVQSGWISIPFATLVDFVKFDLDCTFFKACGQLLQQKVGIPMGKSSSPALACLLCVYNEFLFLSSLGCDRRLISGIRMVDDVSVFVRYRDGNSKSEAVAQSILSRFRFCYDSNLVLECTSDGDCWDFLGCVLKVLDWPWGIQCVALNKNQRFFKEDRLRFQSLQDYSSFSCREQKMAVICSCLHRAKAYTTMAGMEVVFLLTLKIELRRRDFPDEYFDNALPNFSCKFGGIWEDWVTYLTVWGSLVGGRRKAGSALEG